MPKTTTVGLSLQWNGSEAFAAGAEAIAPPTAKPADITLFNRKGGRFTNKILEQTISNVDKIAALEYFLKFILHNISLACNNDLFLDFVSRFCAGMYNISRNRDARDL